MLFFGCGKENKFSDSTDVFYEEIDSIVSSFIGRLEPITFVFKEDIKYKDNLEKAVSFNPKQEGKLEAANSRTVVFTPSKPYKGGEAITLVVDVGLLKTGKGGQLGFQYDFTIQEADVSVQFKGISPSGKKDSFNIKGVLKTDIPAEKEVLKKLLSAENSGNQNAKEIQIDFTDTKTPGSYEVLIKNIKREKEAKVVTINLDGNAFGADVKESYNFEVPGEGVFEVSSFNADSASEVTVYFSEFLDKNQDVNAFVSIWSKTSFGYRTEIRENKIKIYTNGKQWADDCRFEIKKGLRSSDGNVSKKDFSFYIKEIWDAPQINFVSGGNILPVKDKAEVLIKTKNVRGICMQAFNIYGHNMLQFFQMNSISGYSGLNRVGEPVWSGNFEFDWNNDMKNRDVVRAVDISALIKKFPTGMFELKITFSKKDSMYKPSNSAEDFSHMNFPENKFGNDEYDYADSEEYSWSKFWEQKENPAHPAFYLKSFNSAIERRKNILISNIGLAAKKDDGGNVYAAVTDLLTAKPLSGAKVSVFTFAQRELFSGNSNGDGIIVFEKAEDAAFISAEKDGQTSWLKLNSAPLSTSHFAVDGEKSKEGVKGFIYGERGIWRPGDKIHLVFILQDKEKTLPKEFPVEFTLTDPKGRQTERRVLHSSVDGFYKIDTGTDKDAATGNWTAAIKAGGNAWQKILKIEAIVPNRLFVELKNEAPYLSRGKNVLDFSGEWLHGAKASNLKGEISCRYLLNTNPFPEYKNYFFINEGFSFERHSKKIWEGSLDSEGRAKINLDLETGGNNDIPGKLKAVFENRIYEPSGAFSTEHRSFDYSPYRRYAGFKFPESKDRYREDMLYTDTEHTVDLLLLTPDGKLFSENAELTVSLYKLRWRWWWESDAYTDAAYNSDVSAKLVTNSKAKIKNGRGAWKFNIKDEDWGRYLLVVKDEKEGHSSSGVVYVDTNYWASRGSGDTNGSATMLMLTAGKSKYFPGETAEVTFPASSNSAAFITVEKNGKILEQKWIRTKEGTNSYKIPVTEGMTPNIYVHVSLLQEYKQTSNSLPIRLYGIIPIMVENRETRLSPVIAAAEKFESGGKAKLTVSEKNGKPMTFTVAVVDEGLLGLTAFKTANPWNSFYRKEASAVSSWDIFDSVIGAFGGKIETLLAAGGDALMELGRGGSKNAERFKPVVLFFGPYSLDSKSEKEIEFQMPQYTGAVRIMVTAGKNSAYGVEEKTVRVGSDLIVLPTLPRTLGVGEEIQIPVTVFNGTPSKNIVNVNLKGEGAVTTNSTKKVSVPANSSETVIFKIKTDKPGKAVFKASASGSASSKKAEAVTEINVLSRGTNYMHVKTENIGKKEIKTINMPLSGETGSKKISVEISQMPSLGLDSRLSFLLEYPHGCIEQITSKAFPQLYLSNFLEMDGNAIQKAKNNIISVLERYSSYQTHSGGFAYWPGDSHESLWGSCYAGHFMTEAKKAGYTVKDSIYEPWLARQIQLAKEWSPGYMNDPSIQAYRLYILASAGKPDMGAMNRLKNSQELSALEACLLANAYAFAGNNSSALGLIKNLTPGLEKSKVNYRNFGSSIRDAAMMLQTYTLVEDKAKALKLVPKLAEICRSSDYLSTQETAWLLISLAPHYNFDKKARVKCFIGYKEKKINVELGGTAKIIDMEIDEAESYDIKAGNTGEIPFYVTVKGQARLPAGSEKEIEGLGNLSMQVKYVDEDGNEMESPDEIKLGSRFTILVNVYNDTHSAVENIALTLPIPTGWEITNKRIAESSESRINNFDYQDIRDSHVYTYFSLKGEEYKSFSFEATAAYGGSYYLPAIYAEAMYDNTYKAWVKGGILKAELTKK